MADRLTIKQNNDNYYFVNCDINDIPNKLGELEDILEKYGIESVEELENIFKTHHTFDTEISWAPKRTKNYELMIQIMLEDEKGRDYEVLLEQMLSDTEKEHKIWRRACELACDAMTKLGGDDCCGCRLDKKMCDICENKKALFDYFYQQAKKKEEKNDV